jgi:hypothetical protein
MVIESVYINGVVSYLDPYVHEALWFRLSSDLRLSWFYAPEGAFGPEGVYHQRLHPLPIGSLISAPLYDTTQDDLPHLVETFVMYLPLSISSLMSPYIQHPIFHYVRQDILYQELGRPLP